MYCGLCNFFRIVLIITLILIGSWQMVLATISPTLSKSIPHFWGGVFCFVVGCVILVIHVLDNITKNDDSVDYGKHVYPNEEMKIP